MEKKIEKLVSELLDKLEIKPETLAIVPLEGGGYQLNLQLLPQEAGILIGYHGDTIASLQLMLNLLLYKQHGEWAKLVVNVGDYREKRLEVLKKMALDTAHRVKFSSQPVALFNLNPYERRLIHEFLSTDSAVSTESEGEGRDRHLIVKPK